MPRTRSGWPATVGPSLTSQPPLMYVNGFSKKCARVPHVCVTHSLSLRPTSAVSSRCPRCTPSVPQFRGDPMQTHAGAAKAAISTSSLLSHFLRCGVPAAVGLGGAWGPFVELWLCPVALRGSLNCIACRRHDTSFGEGVGSGGGPCKQHRSRTHRGHRGGYPCQVVHVAVGGVASGLPLVPRRCFLAAYAR
jgi:hypothetical protein